MFVWKGVYAFTVNALRKSTTGRFLVAGLNTLISGSIGCSFNLSMGHPQHEGMFQRCAQQFARARNQSARLKARQVVTLALGWIFQLINELVNNLILLNQQSMN